MCLAIVITLSITSCKKARLNKATTTAEDNGTAENLYNDVFASVDDASKSSDDVNKTGSVFQLSTDSCATVTVNPPKPDTTFPKTVTIDFGTGTCTSVDGRTRKGKIIATLSGRYRNPGTVITITLDNYYVNNNHIEGTKTITNNGRNSNNNISFTVSVAGGKVTTAEGDVIEFASTRTNEWIEGESTKLYIFDDKYSITGSGSGVNREGRAFTVTITEALIKMIGCKWIVDGKIEVSPDDLDSRILDYGDGTCDDQATLTVGNKQKTITLR